MSYGLAFYSFPSEVAAPSELDPDAVAAHIEQTGEYAGVMFFRAGESMLFFKAIDDLLGIPVTPLLFSQQFGVDPDEEDPIFGGLTRPAAEQLLSELEILIQNPTEQTQTGLHMVETARAMTLDPTVFLEHVKELRDLVAECIRDGKHPVTLYS